MAYYYYYYWLLLYSAVLRSWADSLRSHVVLHEWIAFYSAFLIIHRSGVLTALAWLVPQESAARESQSRRVLRTPYNHALCHFMQSHIRKVYVCLAVTCHLHFWQNDRGLLRATAVTRGWNGYRNKSQHRKLTLEKKILPPLQQGFEPVTFRSRVWRSNHWAIPAPLIFSGDQVFTQEAPSPSPQSSLQNKTNYGCGVLSDAHPPPTPPHTHTWRLYEIGPTLAVAYWVMTQSSHSKLLPPTPHQSTHTHTHTHTKLLPKWGQLWLWHIEWWPILCS